MMRWTLSLLALASIGAIAALAAHPHPTPRAAAPTLPEWRTWYGDINSSMIQAGAPFWQQGYGTQSYQADDQHNRSSWRGTGQQFVADFDQLRVWYLDELAVCEFWCAIPAVDDVCNSMLDGGALCSYDYLHYAQYMGDEIIAGEDTQHFWFSDPLGPVNISMADHDIAIGVDSGVPVSFNASFHPFGQWAANITSLFLTFSAEVPPEANFNVDGITYCEMGTEDQCDQVTFNVRGMPVGRALRAAAAKNNKIKPRKVLHD